MHDPAHSKERKHHAAKGGRRAKRATLDLKRLQHRLEELAEMVLAGTIDRGDASVAGQLLGGARACIRDGLAAREQEEMIERLEAPEGEAAEQRGA